MTIEELQQAVTDLTARTDARFAAIDELLAHMRAFAAQAAPAAAVDTEVIEAPAADPEPAPLAVGDKVRVVAGDWGNNTGEITAIDDDQAEVVMGWQNGIVPLSCLVRIDD